MALDATEDIALSLKKRARRRLVGSIALVLLLLTVLPNVLKNRMGPKQQQINITMPETLSQTEELVEDNQPVSEMVINDEIVSGDLEAPNQALAAAKSEVKSEAKNDEVQTPEGDNLKAILASQAKPKLEKGGDGVQNDTKNVKATAPVTQVKQKEATTGYLVQLGVFSEPKNVERLQSKITAAGFSSNTSTIKKGAREMIRLRVGPFITREAAANALKTLEKNGLSGIVMTDD